MEVWNRSVITDASMTWDFFFKICIWSLGSSIGNSFDRRLGDKSQEPALADAKKQANGRT